jgi:hypothetical protein
MNSTTKIRNTVLAAFAALVALALPASAVAVIEPLQWANQGPSNSLGQPVGGNPASPPTQQNTYTLATRHKVEVRDYGAGPEFIEEELVNQNETFGVDLDYYGPSTEEPPAKFNRGWQWQFVRQAVAHTTVAIPATEKVALYNTSRHQYLAVGRETFGVDLVWSNAPHYEWQVAVGNSQHGVDINGRPRSKETELYNTTEHGYLIEGHQKSGVDLSWVHASFSTPRGYVAPRTPVVRPPIVVKSRPVSSLG